jgi:hypothetical protein
MPPELYTRQCRATTIMRSPLKCPRNTAVSPIRPTSRRLAEGIRGAIGSRLLDVHTAPPGRDLPPHERNDTSEMGTEASISLSVVCADLRRGGAT